MNFGSFAGGAASGIQQAKDSQLKQKMMKGILPGDLPGTRDPAMPEQLSGPPMEQQPMQPDFMQRLLQMLRGFGG